MSLVKVCEGGGCCCLVVFDSIQEPALFPEEPRHHLSYPSSWPRVCLWQEPTRAATCYHACWISKVFKDSQLPILFTMTKQNLSIYALNAFARFFGILGLALHWLGWSWTFRFEDLWPLCRFFLNSWEILSAPSVWRNPGRTRRTEKHLLLLLLLQPQARTFWDICRCWISPATLRIGLP